MGLSGKVCIITGGGSGIGKATALQMASEGAIVALVGRTLSKVDAVKTEIKASGGRAESYAINVADKKSVSAMVTRLFKKYGTIDVLLNNAGHSSPHRRLLSTTPEEIEGVVESNLLGTIYCTQAVVPYMTEAGEGTIINVASMAGVNPSGLGGMIYSAVKAAVINFTGFLNSDLRNTGIRASVVIPGEVDTPILDKRPVPPSKDARSTMVTSEDTAEAITLIARLPIRTNIPELQIRPTYVRDTSGESELI